MAARWSPDPHSILRRSELLSRGVHPRRLASDEFREVLPGFCTPSSAPASLLVIARVLQRHVLPGAVISDATAAELMGFPLPTELQYAESGVLHCTVPPGGPRRCGRAVRIHVRTPADPRHWRGLQLSNDVALLSSLAAVLDHGQLVACCDYAVSLRTSRPRVPLEQLRRRASEARGIPGVKQLRRALADARERVESPKETELRLLLREHGFAEPAINLPISAPGSGETFRLDLSYPCRRIAIEYDGDWHRTDRARFRRDRRKDDVLHELGWSVVRAVDSDLTSPSKIIDRLRHLGASRD